METNPSADTSLTPTSVDENAMATLVRIGYTGENGEEQPDSPEAENEEGEEGEDEVDSPKSPRFEGTGDMQGGAIEMGSLLPDSDVKRYESTENLNVTLHQVSSHSKVSFHKGESLNGIPRIRSVSVAPPQQGSYRAVDYFAR